MEEKNSDRYDVAIIGAGVAGAFAAYRIAQNNKSVKTILFDLGRPPGKRRRQLEGWFGCFPAGDGKLYPGDMDKISTLVDGRRVKSMYSWALAEFEECNSVKVNKDTSPNAAMQKRLTANGYEFKTNDYIQWKPDSIHQLSRNISEYIDSSENITLSFDNEVYKISKKKGMFHIITANGEFFSKKILMCVGRSGWRWVTKLYKELGLPVNDDYAKIGIRAEISGNFLKDLNKSHCTITTKDLEIGPFSWNGTIIPEDHADLVISSFRSNEDRWKSDKVSFSILANRKFENKGVYEADRLAKLAFLLFNDRVNKEKIRMIIKNQSQLNLLPEYSWLKETIEKIDLIIPNLIVKGSYYAPNISPMAAQINLDKNLSSELEGFYVAGESAGIDGVMGAAVSGAIIANSACK